MTLPGWVWWAAGLAALVAIGGGGVLAVSYWQQSANAQKWLPVLHSAEDMFGIPRDLLARLAYQESIGFKQSVIDGTRASPAGALGLMQLMPQYFTTVNRPTPYTDSDTIDQIQEGAQNLATLYQQLSPLAASSGQNPWALALAGYNAGEGAVKRYGGVPPFTETQGYVQSILADVPAAAAATPA